MALSQVGTQTYSNTSLANTATQAIGATTNSGTLVYNIHIFNGDASNSIFVQFFDALAANVTLGATTPKFVLGIPAKWNLDTGLIAPIEFRTAVTIACTATATGSGAPSTNAVLSLDYVSA